MAKLKVATTVDASVQEVWADLSDISSHVEWMNDAVALRFTSDQTSGVGTTFDCDTQVGPFRLTDKMEITEWVHGKAIGVRHVGLVAGEGVITLRRKRRDRTQVVWAERLTFPWWMGGPIGAFAAKPVLGWVWRGSMRNLSARFVKK